MGSFNTTCAITRTPIRVGDLARVFFLEMNVFELNYNKKLGLFTNIMTGASCYPWEHFKIIGYPLLGSYDDYNNYDFKDQDMSNLTLKCIQSRYIPNRVADGCDIDDYNRYHDYIDVELTDMNVLQKMEHSGALRIKGQHGFTTVVAKMAIHEDVYQMMLERELTSGWGDNRKTETCDEYTQSLLHILPEAEQKQLELMRERLHEMVSDGVIDPDTQEPYTIDSVESILSALELQISSNVINSNLSNEWFSHNFFVRDMKENPDFASKIAEAIAGTRWCATWMFENNYEFAPVMTSGQSYNTKQHVDRLRALADIIEQKQTPDEEHIDLEIERVERLYMSLGDVKSRMNEWYGETTTIINDMNAALESIAEQSSFVYNDNSLFDKFVKKYELLYGIDNGTEIHFKE